MMFGLYLGIAAFFFAVLVLAKNIQEIKTDPMIYGMEKHEFNSCICYMDNGVMTTIKLTDFIDDKMDNELYQGPVPEGYDEQHFRETGELKLGADKNWTS